MEVQKAKISVKELTEEIANLIKEEIVATYSGNENVLQIHFLNGQKFRVAVEEI